MALIELKPPLPPPLSHEGIQFIAPIGVSELSPQLLAAIGTALQSLLPAGDFETAPDGRLSFSHNSHKAEPLSLWRQAGLLEGIERSTL